MQPHELDQEVRSELLSLSKETSDLVARHLVMTGRLLEDDPAQALAHARAAGAMAGRVGAVREAVGLAAYAAGQWGDALSELRAARRITGQPDHLPVMADCERALGRPERALAAYDDPDVKSLDQAVRVELAIVVAGARRDLGQADAAVLLLQGPARATTAKRGWAARLWYAYADALLAAGRTDQAQEWFGKAAEVDTAGHTDAGDRLLALQGVVIDDSDIDSDDIGDDSEAATGHDAASLQALVAGLLPLSEPTAASMPVGREPSMPVGREPARPDVPGRAPVPTVTFVPAPGDPGDPADQAPAGEPD